MIEADTSRGTTRLTRRPSFAQLALLPIPLLAAALVLRPGLARPALLVGVLLAVLAVAYIALDLSPAILFSLAIALQTFSGNWGLLGVPLGLDRILFATTLLVLLRRAWSGRLGVRLRWRTVHTVLVAVSVLATLSALWAGTLFTAIGSFALLDRLGLVPFAAFFLAPLVYRDARERDRLLVVLVCLGAYLGTTAGLEGLGLRDLAVPTYIADETLGLHVERARGPFLEAVANGLVLFHCAVACAVAAYLWRGFGARACAGLVGLLCLGGTLFTVTRAVWLGTFVGTVAAMAVVPKLRRLLVPAMLVAALLVGSALTLVPGFAENAGTRSSAQRPIWDRYNTNAAAVRVVQQETLRGVGWQNFARGGIPYLRQSDDYPITGVGIEVHNVFLSHAAELGLPTAALYILAVGLAVGGGLLRRGPPDLLPWRVGLVAVSLSWLAVAMFGPLSYALPNTLLWCWAGIVLSPCLRVQVTSADAGSVAMTSSGKPAAAVLR